MKLIISCCLILLLFGSKGVAQDTAWQRIQNMKADTLKADAISTYARSFVQTDRKKAQQLFMEMARLSSKLNDPERTGIAWYNIGFINGKEAKDREALENFKTALVYFKKSGKANRVATCLLNIGGCLEKIGDMDGSINAAFEAIQVLEKTEFKPMLCLAYNHMGVTFYNLLDYTKSEEYFRKSIVLAKEIKDTGRLVYALHGMAACVASAGKFIEAERYAKESMQFATASGQNFHLCLAHEGMAEVYIKAKQPKLAIAHAQKALDYARAAKDVHQELITLISLSDGYGLANDQKSRLHYLNIAKDISEKQGIMLQLSDIYKGLSEAHAALKNDKEAFSYYKKHIFYKDSLKGERDKNNVTELETRYQTAKKEKQLTQQLLAIAKKEVDLRKSREINFYSIGASLIALLGAVIVFLYYHNRRRLHQQQLQAIQREKELQVLQAAMEGEEKERSRIAKDLHDGVAGMLAAAKMHFSSLGLKNPQLPEANEYNQGIQLLDEATSEVRKTSHNLMPEVLLRYGLNTALAKYCKSISNNQLLIVRYESWGGVKRYNTNFELSVYRIVQELLNNILKHSKATEASVQLSIQGEKLCVIIEDNGIGLRENAKTTGMGLHSLATRVEAMNGRFEIDARPESGVAAYIEFNVAGLEISNIENTIKPELFT